MEINVSGGTPQIISGFMPQLSIDYRGEAGFNLYDLKPKQLVGLYPMDACPVEDCNVWCEYKHKLFVNVDIQNVEDLPPYTIVGVWNPATQNSNEYNYKNDTTTFLFDFWLMSGNGFSVTPKWTFEKFSKEKMVWEDVILLSEDLNNGAAPWLKYYPQGFFSKNKTYEGLTIDWAHVFQRGHSYEVQNGAGAYGVRSQYWRVRLEVEYYDATQGIVKNTCNRSVVFEVLPFSCEGADKTIKFEKWITGTVGDPYEDYYKHNLCDITMYDSVRMDGIIGWEKIDEYRTENVKWGSPFTGKIEHVKDEAIQKWECHIWNQPHYMHKRFSTFGLMMSSGDTLLATDYNLSNSQREIKRLNVIRDSNYPTTFIDNDSLRGRIDKSKANIVFKRGVQSLYKYTCCDNKLTGT